MKLKEALKEEGITIIWLSERLGLSRPTLYKYLADPGEFKIRHLKQIAKYLGITEREAIINYFI